jgi:hypothetical protein
VPNHLHKEIFDLIGLCSQWLIPQEFAYRIPLGAGYFLLGGFISLGVAPLVMSG